MANSNGLGILREIHKTRVAQIKQTYSEEHREKKEVIENELEGNAEFKKLKAKEEELEKTKAQLQKIDEEVDKLKLITYRKHNLPLEYWNYEGVLLAEENDRYEEELRDLSKREEELMGVKGPSSNSSGDGK